MRMRWDFSWLLRRDIRESEPTVLCPGSVNGIERSACACIFPLLDVRQFGFTDVELS